MTREEFIAQRFASRLKVALQRERVEAIEAEHMSQLEAKLALPKEKLYDMEREDEEEHSRLMAEVGLDFIPYKRHDFVAYNGRYFQVNAVRVNLAQLGRYNSPPASTLKAPPTDFLFVTLEVYEIRKSGTLAQYTSTIRLTSDGLRKADLSEDLRLRRAVKQRMRKRLEGGD